jgi:hypothetical protein
MLIYLPISGRPSCHECDSIPCVKFITLHHRQLLNSLRQCCKCRSDLQSRTYLPTWSGNGCRMAWKRCQCCPRPDDERRPSGRWRTKLGRVWRRCVKTLTQQRTDVLYRRSQILFSSARLPLKLSRVSSLKAFKLRVSRTSSHIAARNSFTFSAKHFINNEQEHFREVSSSNVDDRYVDTVPIPTPTNTRSGKPRTQHEIYAAPFLKSVHAGVAAVMCSYSTSSLYSLVSIQLRCNSIDRVNGIYACEQPGTLNDLLKG